MAKATFAIEVDDDERDAFTALTKPECTALVAPIKDRIHGLSARISAVISGRTVNLDELESAQSAVDELLELMATLPETEEQATAVLHFEQQRDTLAEIQALKSRQES